LQKLKITIQKKSLQLHIYVKNRQGEKFSKKEGKVLFTLKTYAGESRQQAFYHGIVVFTELFRVIHAVC
jgi:hypothetical protein